MSHWKATFTDHETHGVVEVQGPEIDDWFSFRVEYPRPGSYWCNLAKRLSCDPLYERAYEATERACAHRNVKSFTFTRED